MPEPHGIWFSKNGVHAQETTYGQPWNPSQETSFQEETRCLMNLKEHLTTSPPTTLGNADASSNTNQRHQGKEGPPFCLSGMPCIRQAHSGALSRIGDTTTISPHIPHYWRGMESKYNPQAKWEGHASCLQGGSSSLFRNPKLH
jgi:hypothetical protein